MTATDEYNSSNLTVSLSGCASEVQKTGSIEPPQTKTITRAPLSRKDEGKGCGFDESSSSSSSSPPLSSVSALPRRCNGDGFGDGDISGAKELHVAPMLDYSKREFRAFLSVLSTRMVPWTEMVVDDTIAHSSKLDDHLQSDFGKFDNDVVCQIGGNDPELCGRAMKVVAGYGYGEVNLNVDCPSERVAGRREFGAVLMREDKLDTCVGVVRAMVEAAEAATSESSPLDGENGSAPRRDDSFRVSVKCRVGVDDHDSLRYASRFIGRLRDEAGCCRFVLHARKCVLGGLMSARQNRSVPPLNYPRVYELCRLFPDCEFWVNGGIGGLREAREICYGRPQKEVEEVDVAVEEEGEGASAASDDSDEEKKEIERVDAAIVLSASRHQVPCHLCSLPYGSCVAPLPRNSVPNNLRGVMLGRAAINNPSLFWDVDRYFYGLPSNPCKNRREALTKYAEYLEGLYPRRCCDDSNEVTWKVPTPAVSRVRECCDICREFYGNEGEEAKATLMPAPLSPPLTEGTVKIAPRIIGRSLKPVRGIFFGLPGAKAFVRELDRLGMLKSVRNCGPGYILRKSMVVVPVEALEWDFVQTEDLPLSGTGPVTARAGGEKNARSFCSL